MCTNLVKALIFTFTVAMSLSGCGGGGGSNSNNVAVTPPVATAKLETAAQINLGQIDIPTETKYVGSDNIMVNLLATGDINGDGYDDLVLALIRTDSTFNPSGSITPLVLFFDPATSKFKTNSQLQSIIGKNQHPRQAALIDIDGDGRLDIFIADHGYDDAPYGAQNTLILNKSNGFINATNLLPQYADYSHGLITDDFDLNGKKDLLILNNLLISGSKCQLVPNFIDCTNSSGQQVKESYVLFNNGSLTRGMFNLSNPNDINFTSTSNQHVDRINVGSSADFNKDGIPDLIIGNNSGIKILESMSIGNYKSGINFSPSDDFKKSCGNNATPYSYITAQDLDGDGVTEIVASYNCEWAQNEFQVLKRDNGSWKDVTSTYFPDQSINRKNQEGGWCYKIIFEDLDNDGKKDLICNSGRGFGWDTNNVFWFNKDGKFMYNDMQLTNRNRSGWHTPITLNNNRYLLGLITSNSKIDIVAWKIK